jgi:hypothetical protein
MYMLYAMQAAVDTRHAMQVWKDGQLMMGSNDKAHCMHIAKGMSKHGYIEVKTDKGKTIAAYDLHDNRNIQFDY